MDGAGLDIRFTFKCGNSKPSGCYTYSNYNYCLKTKCILYE